jgi:poly-gamma-glutamate synthesis protein (capsule biosynthesis protein)
MKILSKGTLAILPVLFFFSCTGLPSSKKIPVPAPEAEITTESEIQHEAASGADYLTIVAAGDNLIHEPIIRAGFVNGGYSFDSMYDKIKGYILPADIAFVNQETVLVNKDLGYSGYPLFGSPKEIGTALAATGFNIINHATNHIMDKGEAGILSSMDFWDSYKDIHYLGIHRSEEDRTQRHVIISKNNFKIGFLSYTYGTNGIPLPRGKFWLVSLIERGKMAADIKALRPLCDYLVVSMHWGDEYKLGYNKEQENLAVFLAEQQVDLVIGHHPHVIEPLAIIKRSNGGSMPVFYSLGNFFSAHMTTIKETLLGGIMYVRLKKIKEAISIEEIGIIPVITHYDAGLSSFGVYPLHEYSEDLAARHWNRRRGDGNVTYSYFIKLAGEMFGPALIMENPFTREKVIPK